MQHSTLFLKLLEKRGFQEDFLHPRYENLSDPFLLPDMKKAAKCVRQAVEKEEKILIYGDYDVDGVTATAIMRETLVLAGAKSMNIIMMLPDRFSDGYGMSNKIIERAKTERVGLVITVDCGASNGEIIDLLAAEGIDTVVTDHHELMGEVPRAVAVVDAKRADMEVPDSLKHLCGAGVAFFLARALEKEGLIPEGHEKWLLDLTMIGTICDAMELTGDNRIICRFGMLVLGKTRRIGLKELMRVAGVKKIDTDAIGFQLGPRLNAAGRMKSAEIALQLLLSTSNIEAIKLTEELEELNTTRKNQQMAAVREIEERGISDEPVLVVAGNFHEGIIGIIAGNLTEKYKKPAFVLTETEEGVMKGSGRSFGEFSLAEAIGHLRDYLLGGGGHAEACGISIEKERLEDFAKVINDYYRSLNLKNQERFLEIREDLKVKKLASINLNFMGELELLEPFGCGNPEPLVMLENMEVVFLDRIGKTGQHLKLTVRDAAGGSMRLVAFSAPEEWFLVRPKDKISLIIRPMVNEWNGVSSVEGMILEMFFGSKGF